MRDKRLEISNRVRIEYAFTQSEQNLWRFRNETFIATVKPIGKMKVHPFIYDELFFSEKRGFDQNRLGTGLSWVPNEHTNPRLFYRAHPL